MAVCCILMHFIPLILMWLTGWYRGKPSAGSAHVIWSHECDVVVQWADEPMSRCMLDDDQMMVISCDITTLPMWLPREPGGSSQTKLLCCIHVHICSLKETHEPLTPTVSNPSRPSGFPQPQTMFDGHDPSPSPGNTSCKPFLSRRNRRSLLRFLGVQLVLWRAKSTTIQTIIGN